LAGLVYRLRALLGKPINEVRRHEGPATVYGDSQLVINQLNGKWDVNGGIYLPYYRLAAQLLQPLKPRVTLQWILRDQNILADALSKSALPKR
jgi:ribonuclease HI